MNALQDPLSVKTYELEIPIDAPRADVWRSLTAETNGWWLPDFHVMGSDTEVTFDPSPGGRLVEVGPNGGGLLWYTVQMCVPEETLYLVGHIAPPWGGPATTILHLALKDTDAGTLLVVRDHLYGVTSDEQAANQSAGWKQLFGEGLKDYIEGKAKR